MTIKIQSAEWRKLEDLVVDDYMQKAIAAWDEVYGRRWNKHYAPLPYKKLHYYGLETIKACERRDIELQSIVMPLQLLVWQAVLLGFPDAFIVDCYRYVLDECQGSDFGLQWLELSLRRIEQQVQR